MLETIAPGTAIEADDVTPYADRLFQQPWWLNAVAPGAWREITVMSGGEVAARMPLVFRRRLGLTVCSMPQLTYALGPWLRLSMSKKSGQLLSEQKQLMTALIEKIPPCDYFMQRFCTAITNFLPFFWAGFTQTTRYTYRIEDLTDLDAVQSQFSQDTRRLIRKAANALTVRDDLGIDRLLEVVTKTFARQGLALGYDPELVKRIHAACEAHKAGRFVFAEDAAGRLHAAQFVAWDGNGCVGLLSGADPELRGSGANHLLQWEVIKHAATVGRSFDFGGSMIEPVEHFIRSFGMRQVPYLEIRRLSRRMRALNGLREIYAALRPGLGYGSLG